MAIVANLAMTGSPASKDGSVVYATVDILDPHINTVNTGCGTDITGQFATSDSRGGFETGDTGIDWTQAGTDTVKP